MESDRNAEYRSVVFHFSRLNSEDSFLNLFYPE